MNAYEIPNMRFSAVAGGAVSKGRFVTINSDEEGVAATAAGLAVGVSMNQAASGEILEIADGIVMVEAAAPIAAGEEVQVATGGKATPRVAGTGVGIALTGASGIGIFATIKVSAGTGAKGDIGETGPAGPPGGA
jgi:hypothetical protein